MTACWPRLMTLSLVLAVPAGVVAAENGNTDLLRRLPESANALVVVNLRGLKMSPLGRKENWAKKQEQNYLAGMSSFPPLASRVVVGAQIDLTSLNDVWTIALAQMERDVPIATLARSEGGRTESVQALPVILSPRNAYFVEFSSTVVGAITPGDRQKLGQWLRSPRRTPTPFCPPISWRRPPRTCLRKS